MHLNRKLVRHEVLGDLLKAISTNYSEGMLRLVKNSLAFDACVLSIT